MARNSIYNALKTVLILVIVKDQPKQYKTEIMSEKRFIHLSHQDYSTKKFVKNSSIL